MNCEGPNAYNFYIHAMEAHRFPSTKNISPKLACFASTMNKLGVFCISKRKAEASAILQSHLAVCGGRIFSAYFSVNCLLHISINYTENVTDIYAHVQTVDTRRSSPIFQAPGYEANYTQTADA